jgi:hypothetical protein
VAEVTRPDDAAFHFETLNGQYEISGPFDPSGHATAFAIDSTSTVYVSGMFADCIGRALVTLGPAGGAVFFSGPAKINCNKSVPYRMHLLEQVIGQSAFTLDLARCVGQDNGNVSYVTFGPAPDRQIVDATGYYAQKTVKIPG